MAQDPQELRRDIEATRTHLGTTLDAISDRVSPGRIVARRKDRIRDRISSVRGSVMGTASSVQGSVQGGAHEVADRVGSAVGAIGEEAREAPAQIASQTRGNPLAAGLVAFGLGMIVATLLPTSEPEQHAAVALKEKLEPLQDQAKHIGGELKDAVQQSARGALEDIKANATEAVQDVTDEARSAAGDVKDNAGQAGGHVGERASGGNGTNFQRSPEY